MKPEQVALAAKAYATGLFIRSGYRVSENMNVVRDGTTMAIRVKGSQTGSWGLTQTYMTNRDYHGAIDAWLRDQAPETLYCLVQFKEVEVDAMPRVYLAWPEEIAQRLHETAGGRGETILFENHEWSTKAQSPGAVDKLPGSWRFSARIHQITSETQQGNTIKG